MSHEKRIRKMRKKGEVDTVYPTLETDLDLDFCLFIELFLSIDIRTKLISVPSNIFNTFIFLKFILT